MPRPSPPKLRSRSGLIRGRCWLRCCIVALSYVLPFAAMWMTGLTPNAWETGSWADIAGLLGGPLLRIGVVLGGVISAFGMFNALVMSYSRLPLAMAQDGMLPGIFAKLQKKSRAPWVAIVALAMGWAMCLGLGFARLVTIDILLYGTSLVLEFVALAVLRFREPELPRPFRVPGGLFGAIAIGIPPALLLGFAVLRSEHEHIWGMSSFCVRNDSDRGGLCGLCGEPFAEAARMGSSATESRTGGLASSSATDLRG